MAASSPNNLALPSLFLLSSPFLISDQINKNGVHTIYKQLISPSASLIVCLGQRWSIFGVLWEDGNTSLFRPSDFWDRKQRPKQLPDARRCTASLPGCAVGQPRQTDPKRPAATAKKPPRNGNRLYREAVFASLVYGTWPLSNLLLKEHIGGPSRLQASECHFCVCLSIPWPIWPVVDINIFQMALINIFKTSSLVSIFPKKS